MGRNRAAIAAALLLIGLALLFLRSRLRPIATAEWVGDASVGSTPVAHVGHHRVVSGVPKRVAPSSDASPGVQSKVDGGQAAVSIKTVRSLFEISTKLHLNAVEAAENVERYCAETAKLPKPFASPPAVDPDDPSTQERDAAYFLLPRVSWYTHPRTVGTLELPAALIASLRAAGDGWPTALTVADTMGLDFSWMPQLAQFDHWSLATVGPLADQAAEVDPFNMPIPDYQSLMDWAKLRLVQALATSQAGDAAAALGDVQHLADLIASNGILIATQAAAHIVWYEQQLEGAASSAGLPLPPGTPPFADQADYQRFQDLALTGVAFMFPGVDPAVAKRGLACSPTPCAILGEQIGLRREYDSFTDTAEDQGSFGLADRSSCDRTYLQLIETSPSAGIEALDGMMGSELLLEKLFGPEVRARAER